MISDAVVFVLLSAHLVESQSCYWNDGCSYPLFSSKTPYDSVRGDIRDYPVPKNCKAISLWSINRHGNRNPGSSVTKGMRNIAGVKDEIIQSHSQGKGELCAQDIENFKKWKWNETLDVSTSYLTGQGYEELYDIATRLKEKYPHLQEGSNSDFYFRTTNEQRTITSSLAFVHAWSENSNLSLPVDGPWPQDDVIRPYENCDRYQIDVKNGQPLEDQINEYLQSADYLTAQNNVQRRLGITTQLSAEDVYSIYELCRFYRSWESNLKTPWCAAFSYEDLLVMEYRDDIKHYHRNGYGSWVNVNLGATALKDLYENFEAVTQNRGKKLVVYFTHDTMIEMVVSAMGIQKDDFVLQGSQINPNRLWRTSHIGSFASNILAVLNECSGQSGSSVYRVQIFMNEKSTDLCPLEGCTWEEFQNHFQRHTTSNLDFCSKEYKVPESIPPESGEPGLPDGASVIFVTSWVLIVAAVLHLS